MDKAFIGLLAVIGVIVLYLVSWLIQIKYRDDQYGLDLIGGTRGDHTVELFDSKPAPLNYGMGPLSNINIKLRSGNHFIRKEKPLIQRLNEKLNSQQAITEKDKKELKSYILTTLNTNSKAPSSRSLLYALYIYEQVTKTKTTTDAFLNEFEKAYNSYMSNHSFTKANNTTTDTAHRELKLAFEVTQKINDPCLQETANAHRNHR